MKQEWARGTSAYVFHTHTLCRCQDPLNVIGTFLVVLEGRSGSDSSELQQCLLLWPQ
jgi:hypothetical protein